MAELNSFLTSIADAIRSKKGTTDKINANNFASEIASISGGGSNGGVVVVDELPTENIQEGVIYQVNEVSDIDILVRSREGWISYLELIMINLGLTPNITYYVVDSLPSTPNVSDLQTFNPTHIYICENIPYLYGNAGYGDMWLPVIDLYNSMSQEDPLEIKGYVENESEMLEVGVYVTYKLGKQGVLRRKYKLLENNGGWIDYEEIFFRKIKEYSNDKISEIPNYAFSHCLSLASVVIPNVKEIERYAFEWCETLENIYSPQLNFVGQGAFSACKMLTSIDLSNVTKLSLEAFINCHKFESFKKDAANIAQALNLTKCTYIDSCVFWNTKVLSIKLGGNEVCKLLNTDAFGNTRLADGIGYIYVPNDLVDAYKSATNWSTYADQIVGY